MSTPQQRGFSVVEAVIAVLVVAAIGATGYLAYSRMKDSSKTPTASDQVEKASAPTAPTISKAKDLDKASSALDSTNLDASSTDTSQLDAEVSNF
jgi:Tfp pilus assembly protein PilV